MLHITPCPLSEAAKHCLSLCADPQPASKRSFTMETGKWSCALSSIFFEKNGTALGQSNVEMYQTAFSRSSNSGPGGVACGFAFDATFVLLPSARGGEHSSLKLYTIMQMRSRHSTNGSDQANCSLFCEMKDKEVQVPCWTLSFQE